MHQCEVLDEGFDGRLPDEFKKLKTSAVEKVIAWHGGIDNVENWLKVASLDEMRHVSLILKANARTEEFEGNWSDISGRLVPQRFECHTQLQMLLGGGK